MPAEATALNQKLQALFSAVDDQLPAKNQSLTKSETYYRSRVFTAQAGDNALLNAAEPVLCLIFHLGSSNHKPQINTFVENLRHELKVLSSRNAQAGYPAEITQFIHYLLTATIDDQLSNHDSDNTNPPLFQQFSDIENRADGDKHILQIVEQLISSKQKHRELLELVFICLHAGFCHHYKTLPHQDINRDDLIADIYNCLQSSNTENSTFCQPHLVTTKKNGQTPLAVGWLAVFTATLVTSTALLFYYIIDANTQPLLAQIQQIVHTWNGVA